MRFAAFQSVVCNRVSGCLGYPTPPRRLAFLRRPRGLPPAAVPQSFRSGFILSYAFVPSRVSRASTRPACADHLPGASFPLRDTSLRSPLSRASQARSVPPSAFLTPSTVSSSAHLAGLFHPAATSRVHSSGVSSSRTAPRARHPKLPSCRLQRLPAASFIQWLQDPPPAFRAFLHPRVRGAQWWFRPPPARSPPELQPPSGLPSRTVRATFTALSDLGLSRPSSFRPCATCLALASLTSPFEASTPIRGRMLVAAFRSPATPASFEASIPGSTFLACYFASNSPLLLPVRLFGSATQTG
jgi:hypothetical protein